MERKMKQFNISKDIIPISEFKSSLSKWLKNIQNTGHPLVITQNGRPAGVLLSPSEYDELVYQTHFLDSVKRGISDAESGNVYSTKELKKELGKRRQRRIKWGSYGRVRAMDRLSDIEDFISQDSPQRAARFVNYLIQRGEGVSKNPRIGRIVPEISNPNIR